MPGGEREVVKRLEKENREGAGFPTGSNSANTCGRKDMRIVDMVTGCKMCP